MSFFVYNYKKRVDIYEHGADTCLVSDDVNNWIGIQWMVEHDSHLL